MTEPIVTGAAFDARKDAISFVRLFKLFLGLVTAWITIRVILQRQFSIGALQFLFRGFPVDAEHLVIISFTQLVFLLPCFYPLRWRCVDNQTGLMSLLRRL